MSDSNGNMAKFSAWLDEMAKELGLEALACIRMDSPALANAGERYSRESLAGMPDYAVDALPFKQKPASFAPWAKSELVATASFKSLPAAPGTERVKLAEPDSPTAGLVAGYALKLDYHIFARRAMRNLGEALARNAGHRLRVEPHCDATPLPERALAIACGLGMPGVHRCLLAKGSREGVFIAGLLSEEELPERIFQEDAADLCNRCGACVAACPNGALGDEGRPFAYERCIEALCSETRGALTQEQAKSIGFWVAGCGECVKECQRSKMPPPVSIDLKWLLLCPSAELKKALASTPLEHEGPTLLRRNALAVLRNRGAKESLELIREFKERTGSDLLSSFAEAMLKQKQ